MRFDKCGELLYSFATSLLFATSNSTVSNDELWSIVTLRVYGGAT